LPVRLLAQQTKHAAPKMNRVDIKNDMCSKFLSYFSSAGSIVRVRKYMPILMPVQSLCL
jgi:hypothetical protein